MRNRKDSNTGRGSARRTSSSNSKGGDKSKGRPKGKDDQKKTSRVAGKDDQKKTSRVAGKDDQGKSQRVAGKYDQKKTQRVIGRYDAAKRTGGPVPTMSDETRLNKFLATAGICSRRDADDLITAGLVEINGKVVTELGTKVKPGDDVRYAGENIKSERKKYLLLNKPKDYITTMEDPQGRKTVAMLIDKACKERLYPVGRLDRQTTGLLLFTNDGDLAKKLTHPSYKVTKLYHVQTEKNVSSSDLQRLTEGVTLEDGVQKADAVSYVADGFDKKQVGVELHSGKNRVVRRMFEEMGYKVLKLDRVTFSGLTKKDLPRGKWRFLSEQEIGFLKMGQR